jgi:hypothetical protein
VADELSVLEFEFVDNDRLRGLLKDYHAQALLAHRSGAYIGSLAASGAVLEGVLTWALLRHEADALTSPKAQRDRQGNVPPLPEWNVTNLIAVAVDLNLLGATAKDASWAVKDFRNFIHPYKLLDSSRPRWRALAQGSLAAIEDISGSLSGRLRS